MTSAAIRHATHALAATVIVVSVGLVLAACGSAPAGPSASPLTTVDLASFRQVLATERGTPVVMNVWASWCGPCIAEADDLAKLARRYDGRVRFIGLDVDDRDSAARAFIAKHGWTFPSYADPTGAVRNGMGWIGQPVTVVYDAQGRQVYIEAGTIDPDAIGAALSKVAPPPSGM